jgi:hypothetical protein
MQTHLRFWAALALALGACGSTAATSDASIDPVPDAKPIDAGTDAAIDAPTDAAATGGSRIDLTAGGRLTGGTFTVDVQLGHSIAPQPIAGGTTTLTPAPPVVP